MKENLISIDPEVLHSSRIILAIYSTEQHLQIHTSLAGVPVMFREKKVFFPSSSSYSCTM